MDAFLKSNTFVRLLAFILAVMLWLIVKGGTLNDTSPTPSFANTTETLTVPFEVRLNNDQVSLKNPSNTISLRVHGDRLGVLQTKINPSSMQVFVDARGLTAGTYSLPIQVTDLPPGVVYDPLRISIQLEPIVKKEFPVEIVLEESKDPSGTLHEVDIQPKTVQVVGAESLVSQVKHVKARAPIQGADLVQKRTVLLYAANDQGQKLNVAIQPATVEVTLSSGVKTVPLTTQLKGWPAQGWAVGQITTDVREVTLTGHVADWTQYPITVDVSGMNHTLSRSIPIPVQAGVDRILPAQVNVKIEIVPAVRKSYDQIPIRLMNLHDDMTGTLKNNTLRVTLEGSPAGIEAVKPDDIQAVVDVNGLEPGEHQVPVTVKAPMGIRVVEGDGITVAVKIEKMAP